MLIRTSMILLCVLFSSTGFSAEPRYEIPIDNAPQLGPQNAPITMIEFLDFQ